MRKSPAEGFLSVVDRRLDTRYEIRLAAIGRTLYQLDDSGGEPVILTDVSFGGCQTRTNKFAPQQRVILDLPLLGERRVQVCWVKGRRMGCRFTQPLTREELRKIVEAGAVARQMGTTDDQEIAVRQ